MALDTIRESVATLHESREAIRDGRIAVAEAERELRFRYAELRRRVDGGRRAVELLRTDGPDADLERLLLALDGRPDRPGRIYRADRPDRVSPPR
ncbi:hypothetical protein [Haladaptatus salinisoli]|uniref:hypothetical protein n=1 Tax=Haladaptatus salinisoli TaxID=2884876 RepID=UPI001D0AAC83|nr:hypothetical protein [Haladaptatus salinisoli]